MKLSKYLDDIMTTTNTGLSTTKNYVGTMKKFNRKTKKAEHIGGKPELIVTKNPDGSYKTGRQKSEDIVTIMKENLDKAKEGKTDLIGGIQSRSVVI